MPPIFEAVPDPFASRSAVGMGGIRCQVRILNREFHLGKIIHAIAALKACSRDGPGAKWWASVKSSLLFLGLGFTLQSDRTFCIV
jgi:hypothetical protein